MVSLEVKPSVCVCCSVGVESPSHAIRADADPLARSATSVVITLADKYTYDCPVKILIYPSGRSTASKLTHSTTVQLIIRSSAIFLNSFFLFCRLINSLFWFQDSYDGIIVCVCNTMCRPCCLTGRNAPKALQGSKSTFRRFLFTNRTRCHCWVI